MERRVAKTSSSGGQVADTRRYGDVDESDYVHDEIKELGVIAKQGARKLAGRPQDEEALYQTLMMTGPSKETVGMLKKEKDAAKSAAQTGIYVTYRRCPSSSTALTTKRRTGTGVAENEECTRVGPTHRCFCNHHLQDHNEPKMSAKTGYINPPKCKLCNCTGFSYIPNLPEEVGDGHLTRRKGFDLNAWSPKCKCCGHGSKQHDPSAMSRRCLAAGCRCVGFESHFACVVCDSYWEDHETAFETRKGRMETGRTVDAEYVPLAQVPGVFSELVFGENTSTTSRQQLKGPDPEHQRAIGTGQHQPVQMLQQSPGSSCGGGGSSMYQSSGSSRSGRQQQQGGAGGGGSELPPYCEFCAAVIKNASAKFCSQCGARRV